MAFTKTTLTGSVDTIKQGWTKFNGLIDDLLSTSSGKGASQIGIEDSAGNFTANNVESAIAEIYSDLNYTIPVASGYARRSLFSWKDSDEIYIDSGIYHHSGTSDQTVYWNSRLTFQFGPLGSNSDSETLNDNEFHYIYLDDSAIVTAATTVLTASEFLNNTTTPTYSQSKRGYYNGSDRCVLGILTDSNGNVAEFYHCDNSVLYGDEILDIESQSPGASWTDANSALTIPSFSRKARVLFRNEYDDTGGSYLWRTNGQTADSGHTAGFCNEMMPLGYLSTDVVTDQNHLIEFLGRAGNDSLSVITQGWYFPIGM